MVDKKDSHISTDKSRVKFHLHLRNRRGNSSSVSNSARTIPYDLEVIAQSIQKLAKSTAPIGRVMHYLPKELEKMHHEQDFWFEEYNKAEHQFTKVRLESEQELRPLRDELVDIELTIKEVRKAIHTINSKIYRQDAWIKSRLHQFCGQTA